MKKKPLLSVIIPAYNEEEDIVKCLKSLENQSYKNFEIIVVDDGSIDKTTEIVKKFQKARLLKQKHKGPGEARNFGARLSKGKILIFVDADMTFNKDYLKNLIAPLKNKKITGTSHYETAENLDNIWSKCWGKGWNTPENEKEDHTFKAIRKNKFLELGGFDSKYGYADDRTFWFKYGIKSIVAKKAIGYHKNPETLKEVYKQSIWIGSSFENIFLRIPVIKYIVPFFLAFLSPIVVPLLSFKKCHKNKNFKLLFPWMLIFITVRYFGSIEGIFRKIYFGENVR